jgi:DNA-directed RNA polymerase subunit RPC12/RpoP
MRPEKVNLVCNHCGFKWLESTTFIITAPVIVYRENEDIVKRRLDCPNCDKGVIVDVPKGWLDHE